MLYIKIENDKVVGLKTSWTADMCNQGWTDRWGSGTATRKSKLAEMVADFTGEEVPSPRLRVRILASMFLRLPPLATKFLGLSTEITTPLEPS